MIEYIVTTFKVNDLIQQRPSHLVLVVVSRAGTKQRESFGFGEHLFSSKKATKSIQLLQNLKKFCNNFFFVKKKKLQQILLVLIDSQKQ